METFDEVLEATKRQMEHFVNWHVSLVNTWEYVASQHMQLPLLSATVDGCLESGKDVMNAAFNSPPSMIATVSSPYRCRGCIATAPEAACANALVSTTSRASSPG